MDFEASLTTTTATPSLECTTTAATTTTGATTSAATTAATSAAATPTAAAKAMRSCDLTAAAAPTHAAATPAAITTTANTTLFVIYTPSSDISTSASNPSPVTLWSDTLSHLSQHFFSNRLVGSLEDAVEVAAPELSARNHTNSMLEICDIFGDITDAANSEITWLSDFVERTLDRKKLKHMWYNHFLKALDSSSRVREMTMRHHSAQQRKTRAINQKGDLWQNYAELQQILNNSSGSEKWMRSTMIASQTSRDARLAKR